MDGDGTSHCLICRCFLLGIFVIKGGSDDGVVSGWCCDFVVRLAKMTREGLTASS